MKAKQLDYRTTCLFCGWHKDTGVPYGPSALRTNPQPNIIDHLLECSGPVVITIRLA